MQYTWRNVFVSIVVAGWGMHPRRGKWCKNSDYLKRPVGLRRQINMNRVARAYLTGRQDNRHDASFTGEGTGLVALQHRCH